MLLRHLHATVLLRDGSDGPKMAIPAVLVGVTATRFRNPKPWTAETSGPGVAVLLVGTQLADSAAHLQGTKGGLLGMEGLGFSFERHLSIVKPDKEP